MTAERPYRETPGKEKALEELKAYSGIQFDPQVVEAFLKVLNNKQLKQLK
jgi:HD-GYP domain-containing protein (c-di-GMP phosphodiesterase class II)